MSDNYKPTARRLMNELDWRKRWAVPFARSGGRCEYCGLDLLRDRLGFTTGVVDHLLPKSKYPKLADETDNWVYSCPHCNTIKSTTDVSGGNDRPRRSRFPRTATS